jgi:hypothetical protein
MVPKIACVQPTIRLKRFAGFFFIIKVAHHYDGASNHQFTNFATRHRFGSASSVLQSEVRNKAKRSQLSHVYFCRKVDVLSQGRQSLSYPKVLSTVL